MGSISDGFLVFGSILRRVFAPDAMIFTTLIKGFCTERRILEATKLFKKMVAFGRSPDIITYGTLIKGLCQTGNTIIALNLHEEMINRNDKSGVICKPDVVTYGSIIDGLRKDTSEMLELMIQRNVHPDIVTYSRLLDGFHLIGRIADAMNLFISMMNKVCRPSVVSYSISINEHCKR
ncbi:hypothetical protein CUMW_277830 [Citrus unshiu]|uniref:Pentacotripeptide-repeat region of PRORP domain-containing protein n=1 Tax=Citrus unshiu TaxID=55188 RepID=A0A2H5N420_CITUN|nr:hypothetical protein CUMW_277830 [Citrus unshiu]